MGAPAGRSLACLMVWRSSCRCGGEGMVGGGRRGRSWGLWWGRVGMGFEGLLVVRAWLRLIVWCSGLEVVVRFQHAQGWREAAGGAERRGLGWTYTLVPCPCTPAIVNGAEQAHHATYRRIAWSTPVNLAHSPAPFPPANQRHAHWPAGTPVPLCPSASILSATPHPVQPATHTHPAHTAPALPSFPPALRRAPAAALSSSPPPPPETNSPAGGSH